MVKYLTFLLLATSIYARPFFLKDDPAYVAAVAALTATNPIAGQIPSNGIWGWWPLTGSSTTNIPDISGNNFTGGAMVSPVSSVSIQINGAYQNAIIFSNNQYIKLPNLGANVTGNNPRAVSVWCYPTVYGGGNHQGVPFGFGANSTFQKWVVCLNSYGTNAVSMQVNYGDEYTAAPAIQLNQWNHVVVSFAGGSSTNCQVWVNTTNFTMTHVNSPGTVNTANSSYAIGYSIPDAGNYFTGYMTQLILYDRALTATDVTNLYLNP